MSQRENLISKMYHSHKNEFILEDIQRMSGKFNFEVVTRLIDELYFLNCITKKKAKRDGRMQAVYALSAETKGYIIESMVYKHHKPDFTKMESNEISKKSFKFRKKV
jgi:hypothetical protein